MAPSRSLLLIVPGLVAVSSAAGQDTPITVVALSGTEYPTLSPGARLDSFDENQAIAPDGTVVFTGSVREGTLTRQAVLRSTPAGPQVIAFQGDPAPGAAPGLVLAFLQRATGTGAGAVFRASIQTSQGVSVGQGVYTATPGIAPVVMTGQNAPGLPPGTVLTFFNQCWTAGGSTLLSAQTGPPGGPATSEGLWIATAAPASLSLVAARGQQPPGLPPGSSWYHFLPYTDAVLTSNGQVGFAASLNGGNGGLGIWAGPPASVRLIARDGDRAPGFPSYIRLRLLLGPLANAGGEVLFGATTVDARTDPRPTPPHRVLYLASPSGILTPLAIGGQTAPGTNAAFDLITLGTWPQMLFTDSGRLAFRSTLSGPGGSPYGNSGLWAGRPGDIRLVARNGDQVPGFPPGAVYASVSSYAMNGRGQIVFDARLAGTGVTTSNDEALFAVDPDGHTAPMLRRGDTLTVNGQARTVQSFSVLNIHGSGADGQPAVLNEAGQFAFHIRFLGTPTYAVARAQLPRPSACYANCDGSTAPPVLDAADFACFLQRFGAGDPWANCDGSSAVPVLNVQDFSCFLGRFAAGCP